MRRPSSPRALHAALRTPAATDYDARMHDLCLHTVGSLTRGRAFVRKTVDGLVVADYDSIPVIFLRNSGQADGPNPPAKPIVPPGYLYLDYRAGCNPLSLHGQGSQHGNRSDGAGSSEGGQNVSPKSEGAFVILHCMRHTSTQNCGTFVVITIALAKTVLNSCGVSDERVVSKNLGG